MNIVLPLNNPGGGENVYNVLYRMQLNFPAESSWTTKFRDFNFCIRNLRAQLI